MQNYLLLLLGNYHDITLLKHFYYFSLTLLFLSYSVKCQLDELLFVKTRVSLSAHRPPHVLSDPSTQEDLPDDPRSPEPAA